MISKEEMQSVIFSVNQVLTLSAQENDRLAARFGLGSGDPPIGGLNMVHQYWVIALELLGYYAEIWRATPANTFPDPEATRQENAERVITVTKSAFILTLSAFEFSAKQILQIRPGKFPAIRGRVYLGRIIEESVSAGVIPASEQHPWDGCIEVRNTLVHNNGIADHNATYQILNGPTITLVNGRMIQGNLRFFLELSLWCVRAFGRWSEGYLS